jgi:hypothetical protein
MGDKYPRTLQELRDEAQRCFRLAARVWDEKAQSALNSYGQELQAEAEKMEAAERGARTGTDN